MEVYDMSMILYISVCCSTFAKMGDILGISIDEYIF